MTWNRDKKSWRGEAVKLRILLHVRFFLGVGGLKNDLECDKKSWRGEAVKLRILLHVKVLGGRFKK